MTAKKKTTAKKAPVKKTTPTPKSEMPVEEQPAQPKQKVVVIPLHIYAIIRKTLGTLPYDEVGSLLSDLDENIKEASIG